MNQQNIPPANNNDNEQIDDSPLTLFPLPEEVITSPDKLRDYHQVIAHIFEKLHATLPNEKNMPFTMKDIFIAMRDINIVIGNPPDLPYTYRTGRAPLPDSILKHGNWAIDGAGKGKYGFVQLERSPYIDIPADIEITHILDSTPQIVLKYKGKDEQSILALIRYNHLVDIFTSLTTYHLQGHFRAGVKDVGQVEIDDLYIGINTDGQAFLLPIEAKTGSAKDRLGVVQITNMVKFGRQYFPNLPIRPIGIKLMPDDSYMLLEFNDNPDSNLVATKRYKRYKLYREK